MIEFWFPTPVYFDHINDPGIENKFLEVFNDLKLKNCFQYPPGWDSLKISDPNFKSNLLDDYNLTEFKLLLDKHIFSFLSSIDSNIGFTRSRNYKITTSWMTLSEKESYAHTHMHTEADLSGVFYVRTTGNDGQLFFENPNKVSRCSHVFRHIQDRIYYKPEVGKLILFPPWLEHGVQKNSTEGERVSVSFNIVFER